ncbi:Hypothetical predicted protein [Mytilus galloprovincialis]|uniref:Reverse transcriptase domain-containing protein n=1 Tax=Mytilus galloprovincialis TaxID=29158 RepID=A0A8B6FBI7_MYTGA|nr:Hypothetical predicted protein [Mytilus galloprovincialis]
MAENADVSITVEDEAIVQINQQFTDIQSVLRSLGNKMENSGSSMTFCPSFFSGLPTDDPISWLERFRAWIFNAMKLRLAGSALEWIKNASANCIENTETLFQAFKDHFQNIHANWLLEQQLYDRRMREDENLEDYANDIEKRKDTVIPPMSEKVVVARIRGSSLPDEIIGLTSASPKLLSSGLMTAKLISKVDKNQILSGVAWRCHLGLFQFKRLPMGLKNSPLTFQRVMEAVLRGLNWKSSLVYLDDVIVFSRTFKDHLLHLQQVFERLRNAGLKLHPSKCNFAKQEIRYLGHIFNSEGISPDPEKVTVIGIYPIPTNLRTFLGLSGHNKFEAFVDHSSLKWLLSMNDPVGKCARWNALVQSYDFDIKYRPGKIHTNADGISRRTYDDEVDHSDNWDELPTFDCISQPITDTQRRAELPNDAAKGLTVVTCAAAVTEKDENVVLSNDSIRDYQRIDAWYKDLIIYLETETLPDDPKRRRYILTIHISYVIDNGTLFHIYTQDKRKVKNIDINLQICIPKRLVKLVLEETHDYLLLNG